MCNILKSKNNIRYCGPFFGLLNNKGQGAVEYLIVTLCLIAALLSAPSIYTTISDTMANKYKSYCFAVAISEPPTKAFDDGAQKIGDLIHMIDQVIGAIEDLIEDLFVPSAGGVMPAKEAVKKFIGTLEKVFHKDF
jgi:hypothetical protein